MVFNTHSDTQYNIIRSELHTTYEIRKTVKKAYDKCKSEENRQKNRQGNENHMKINITMDKRPKKTQQKRKETERYCNIVCCVYTLCVQI